MTWRMAKSLEVLLAEINALSPNRDKLSDGGIGNSEHASRSSDHNPHVIDGGVGVVTARDFTNDPDHGIVSETLAEGLRAAKDNRIKYIISNKKISASYATGGKPAWAWRPYTGSNPHNHHCHVSVLSDKAHYDDTSPWNVAKWLGKPITQSPSMPPVYPTVQKITLRKGDKGEAVVLLQSLLNKHGMSLKEDGDFGAVTKAAVGIFQKAHGLIVDGVVGRYSWEALEKS